jgi:hypothetical protein
MAEKLLNDPMHWRNRAEEARAQAKQLNDPEARRKMLEIADGYERIAERAEQRLRGSEKAEEGNGRSL